MYHQTIQDIIQQQDKEVASMLNMNLGILKEISQVLFEQEYISGSTLQEHIEQSKLQSQVLN